MIILINESLLNKWIDFLKRPFTLTYIYINLTSETVKQHLYINIILCPVASPTQQIPAQSNKAQSSPFGIGSSHSYQADPSSYSPLSSPATSSPSGNAYSNLANRSTAFGKTCLFMTIKALQINE